MARELDDAILTLRTNHPEVGLWILKTKGTREVAPRDRSGPARASRALVRPRSPRHDAPHLRAPGRVVPLDVRHRGAGFVLRGLPARTGAGGRPRLHARGSRRDVGLSPINFGLLPAVNGLSRLEARVYGDTTALDRLRELVGRQLSTGEAERAGLVTFAPDELDWDDEMRLAIESRMALSPDAMTGLEGQPAIRSSRDDGVAHLRPAVGLAELDLHSSERGRTDRRVEGLRHRQPAQIRSGACVLMSSEWQSDDRLLAADSQQRRPGGRSCAAARARALAAGVPELVAGGRSGQHAHARGLSAHRRQRRPGRLGRTSAT